jgi:hypothetical protein
MPPINRPVEQAFKYDRHHSSSVFCGFEVAMKGFSRAFFRLVLMIFAVLRCGSFCFAESTGDAAEKNALVEINGYGGCSERGGAKTLLELFVGPRIDDEDAEGEDEEEPLATDRPDFVEASSNVGRGRVQLEAGYTFIHDRSGGVTTRTHSYPEILLRIGLFADWFELRLGQNFGNQRLHGGALGSGNGAEDLYLGVGLALTEQNGLVPESRVVFQTTVPTGADDFTDDVMLPGVNILYGWDVIEDKMTLGMSTSFNRARDDSGDDYLEFAQAITTGFTLTEKLGMYLETFGLMPAGATNSGARPEYYADGGFTYRITNNFQLDIRAGVGLNRYADDFFAGSGFAVRY